MKKRLSALTCAACLCAALALPAAAAGAPAASVPAYSDVAADAWYAEFVVYCRDNGLMAGTSDTTFSPDTPTTRAMMATILYRYAQYKGYDITAKADLSKFTDAAQVGSWAVDAIRWANAEGMINGTSDTTLSPKGSATRAQAAAILTRFCQKIAK